MIAAGAAVAPGPASHTEREARPDEANVYTSPVSFTFSPLSRSHSPEQLQDVKRESL